MALVNQSPRRSQVARIKTQQKAATKFIVTIRSVLETIHDGTPHVLILLLQSKTDSIFLHTLSNLNSFTVPARFRKLASQSAALFVPHPIPENAPYVRPTFCKASGNPPEVQTVALHAHELLAHRDVDAQFFLQNASRGLDPVMGRCSPWMLPSRARP